MEKANDNMALHIPPTIGRDRHEEFDHLARLKWMIEPQTPKVINFNDNEVCTTLSINFANPQLV